MRLAGEDDAESLFCLSGAIFFWSFLALLNQLCFAFSYFSDDF